MTDTLKCVNCLRKYLINHTIFEGMYLYISDAVTIYDGRALCLDHWINYEGITAIKARRNE